jgi:hypothetical protein
LELFRFTIRFIDGRERRDPSIQILVTEVAKFSWPAGCGSGYIETKRLATIDLGADRLSVLAGQLCLVAEFG